MRPVEINLKRNYSGKMNFEKRISGIKISRKINLKEKAEGGAFR